MTQLRTLSNGKGKTLQTHLSDDQAYQLLGKVESEFARSLCHKRRKYKGWTEAQTFWAHKVLFDEKLVALPGGATPQDDTTPQRKPAFVVPGADQLWAIFTKASQHLQYPKMRFTVKAGEAVRNFRLNLAGERSKYVGCLVLTNGEKFGSPNNQFYGWLDPQGMFHPSSHLDGLAERFLLRLADDPVTFASKYGKSTGHCCFCDAELTHDQYGYGPDCAKHWGLPWSRGNKGFDAQDLAEALPESAQASATAPQPAA